MDVIELYWLVTGKSVDDAVKHNEEALDRLEKLEAREKKKRRCVIGPVHCQKMASDK